MNFKKQKEVFVQNGLKNKKVSLIFCTGAMRRENRSHLQASFFSVFHFSVTVLILRELFRRAGGEFGETKGGFCP
jgi:hypothetical protein